MLQRSLFLSVIFLLLMVWDPISSSPFAKGRIPPKRDIGLQSLQKSLPVPVDIKMGMKFGIKAGEDAFLTLDASGDLKCLEGTSDTMALFELQRGTASEVAIPEENLRKEEELKKNSS